MGKLVNGIWHDVWYDTKETKGHFKRSESQFRNWVTSDCAAGPTAPPASRQRPAAITFTCLSPVPGPTAP